MNNPCGVYECDPCGFEWRVSASYEFGGGFAPAAVLDVDGHPMYWRREP